MSLLLSVHGSAILSPLPPEQQATQVMDHTDNPDALLLSQPTAPTFVS